MEVGQLLPILALMTLGIFAILGIVGKRSIEARRTTEDAPKSSLAKDGPGPNPFR